MQSLQNLFESFIEKEQLFSRRNRLVVGVSGGLDSIVLAHLLKTGGFHFEMAHMNFQLRSEESNRDELFVKNLATEWGITCRCKTVDTASFMQSTGMNVQEAARELRYAWMEELIKPMDPQTKTEPAFVLTAHHANDQLETILLNLFRGSGLSGIKGMLPVRNAVRRPLLFAGREMLETYAREQQLSWVEDSSNATNKYNRNRIRHELVPLIRELFPDAVRRVYLNSRNLANLDAFVREHADKQLTKLLEKKGAEQWLPIRKWKTLTGNRFLLFDWLHPFGFSAEQVEAVGALMSSQTGHFVEAGMYRVIKNRDWLILTVKEKEATDWLVLDGAAGSVLLDGGQVLQWNTVPWNDQGILEDASIAQLDADKLAGPFVLRKWKAGDYFYPLGMRKKKKVARFLIDQKISRSEKERIWVLESAHRICWLVAHRIDDRFKVSSSTQRVLEIRLGRSANTAI